MAFIVAFLKNTKILTMAYLSPKEVLASGINANMRLMYYNITKLLKFIVQTYPCITLVAVTLVKKACIFTANSTIFGHLLMIS